MHIGVRSDDNVIDILGIDEIELLLMIDAFHALALSNTSVSKEDVQKSGIPIHELKELIDVIRRITISLEFALVALEESTKEPECN